jgi:hypothetical protein
MTWRHDPNGERILRKRDENKIKMKPQQHHKLKCRINHPDRGIKTTMEDLDETNAANNNDADNGIDDEPAVPVPPVIPPVVAEPEIVPPLVGIPPPPTAPVFFTYR